MTMLAHQVSFPASLGMGPTQIPSTREYTSVPPSHRTPVTGNTQNGPFASPTESEFSEHSEGRDSVRYVILTPEHPFSSPHSPHDLHNTNASAAHGTRNESATG